jgi:hypothetical protein
MTKAERTTASFVEAKSSIGCGLAFSTFEVSTLHGDTSGRYEAYAIASGVALAGSNPSNEASGAKSGYGKLLSPFLGNCPIIFGLGAAGLMELGLSIGAADTVAAGTCGKANPNGAKARASSPSFILKDMDMK